MGHDISPIGNHQLNIQNIQSLAEDIATRLCINIEYGFWGQKEYFDILGENPDNQYIVLGKIMLDKTFDTYELTDDYYQNKQLYDTFGEDIFYNPAYWIYDNGIIPNQKRIEEEKEELLFPQFDLSSISADSTGGLYIYKSLVCNNIPYYGRWWRLCRFFLENEFCDVEYLEYLMNYRKSLLKYSHALGGDTLYYLDDQSEVLDGIGQGDEWNLSWNEFVSSVAEKTQPLMLNVSQFFTDKQYRDEFIKKKAYPLSFMDDFADIR